MCWYLWSRISHHFCLDWISFCHQHHLWYLHDLTPTSQHPSIRPIWLSLSSHCLQMYFIDISEFSQISIQYIWNCPIKSLVLFVQIFTGSYLLLWWCCLSFLLVSRLILSISLADLSNLIYEYQFRANSMFDDFLLLYIIGFTPTA